MDIKNKEKILVTGGGGFIGSAIVKELVKKGFDVYTLNRNIYPKLIELGVKYIQGDVRNKEIVERAVKGKEVVFHIAAKVGYWGLEKEFYDINVAGTKNLLNASKLNGVQKFIYTSTPSVIGYNQDVRNGDQNIPYPNSYLSAYSKTKAVAEKLVLKYNQSHFATIALRPHLVFGPGDNNLIPHLLQNIINGKLPRIGNKKIEVDLTYIDNAVAAHLCALEALKNSNSGCAGKPYFISNNDPVELWSWINQILTDLDIPIIQKSVNVSITYAYAYMNELIWKIFDLKGEPPITRFLVQALSRNHWYNMAPASNDLDYHPKISMDEATIKTKNWLRALNFIHKND